VNGSISNVYNPDIFPTNPSVAPSSVTTIWLIDAPSVIVKPTASASSSGQIVFPDQTPRSPSLATNSQVSPA